MFMGHLIVCASPVVTRHIDVLPANCIKMPLASRAQRGTIVVRFVYSFGD